MKEVQIVEVEILADGRLTVRPAENPGGFFAYVWRAAAGVDWDAATMAFVTPRPREWSYADWFGRILTVVRSENEVRLSLTAATLWTNIAPELRRQMESAAARGILEKAFGYQGDNMQLPVPDVEAALPFYKAVLGFHVISRSDTPHTSAVLARDDVQIGLAQNGGDPTQDGCAFHVKDLAALFAEFKANGLHKERSEFEVERHSDVAWNVFYVIAPDGLCYWFGERQGG